MNGDADTATGGFVDFADALEDAEALDFVEATDDSDDPVDFVVDTDGIAEDTLVKDTAESVSPANLQKVRLI